MFGQEVIMCHELRRTLCEDRLTKSFMTIYPFGLGPPEAMQNYACMVRKDNAKMVELSLLMSFFTFIIVAMT